MYRLIYNDMKQKGIFQYKIQNIFSMIFALRIWEYYSLEIEENIDDMNRLALE